MSEEARDVSRTVPRAVGLVIGAVISLYLLIPLVALSAMPVTEAGGEFTTALATTYAENPMLGIVDNLGLGGGVADALRIYVGLLAAVILTIATNAGIIGLSRLTFSMGQHRQLPHVMRAIHPRFKTPYVAIIVFGGLSAVAIIPGETELLATMYSFGAMLSFTVAHVAVIRLRQRYPDRERGWKPPLNLRLGRVEVPMTAVLGGLGTFAAWIVVMALNTRTLVIGLGWMALGLGLYLLYRRNQGLPLRQTVKVLAPEPLGVEEVEYRSVLVAFEDDPFHEETIATAGRLAADRRRGIHVISLINVPMHLPLDAPLDDAESEAQAKVERAKLIGGLRVTGHTMRVRLGQAGHAIVDEAREIDAAAVVMQLDYRNGAPLYGSTLRMVLGERPCRVIVAAEPTTARRDRREGATAR
jgi:APA family basic amino acid/polyamine antiporter